jgi:signal transduction histidine kinase/CheY-like chemotaxis protein
MFLITNKKRTKILRTVYSLTIALLVILAFAADLNAQSNDNEINYLEEKLKSTAIVEKPEIIERLVKKYQSVDKKKQAYYAEQFVALPDSLIDPETKSRMFALLADFYKTKNKESEQESSDGSPVDSDILKYTFFVISIFLIVAALAWYFVNKNKFEKKLDEIEKKAEDLYNEKYSRLKEVEAKLTKELAPLKEEYEKLNKEEIELKKKLKVLEEANYLKNAFLSNMSHQIRSSLNGISGFADILETELALLGDENLFSYAKKIQQSGSKLENLLTNIIDISTIEANVAEKKIKAYNVVEIIEDVKSISIFKANEKGLVFKTKVDEQGPEILADKEKLKKVLNVLVDNSIKYTSKGFVTLTATFDETKNNYIIEVKDTGAGIPDAYANLIKSAFESDIVDENEKSYQGIGIGLKLCKRFIHLMDGTISISTKENKGTSVRIELPVSTDRGEVIIREEPVAPTVTLLNAPQLGSLDIFIVEDDRMNRMVLEKMLKKSGNVTTTVDGNDAINVIKKQYKKKKFYHVMLFDINLPAPWDGIRLMQEIKKLYPEYRRIPFIAQTAYAMAGDKNRFLEAGFDDYIAKPIMKNELLTLIEKQISKFSESV